MAIDPKTPGDVDGSGGLADSIRSLFVEEDAAREEDAGLEERQALQEDAPEPAAGPQEFRARIGDFLAAPAEARWERVEELEREGAALRRANALEPLVEAVLDLTGVREASREGGEAPGREAPEEAALTLARRLTTPGVATVLVLRLGGDRDPGRRQALPALARLLPEAMAPALAEALADMPDRGARRACLDALGSLGRAARVEAEKMLDDSRWFIVRNGVQLLSEAGERDAVPQLMGALGHEDPRVRREAVLAVARLGGEDAGALLLGMLEDGDSDVRTSAVMGVAALHVERAVRPLLELLKEGGDEDLQVEILRALGRLGDPGAVPAVEKRARGSLFSRPPASVRIAAYRALAAIGTPHALGVIREGAEDRDPEIRKAVRTLLPEAKGEGG